MTPPINSVSPERLEQMIDALRGPVGAAVMQGNDLADLRLVLAELAARRAANTPASPEAETQGACASCNGTGDLGGNPSYGMCPDCDGTGKFPPGSPALPSQVVDDKTIERAAKAIAESAGDVAWEKIEPLYQEGYRDEARAALTAALTLPERGM
jgi:hypothetical protein